MFPPVSQSLLQYILIQNRIIITINLMYCVTAIVHPIYTTLSPTSAARVTIPKHPLPPPMPSDETAYHCRRCGNWFIRETLINGNARCRCSLSVRKLNCHNWMLLYIRFLVNIKTSKCCKVVQHISHFQTLLTIYLRGVYDLICFTNINAKKSRYRIYLYLFTYRLCIFFINVRSSLVAKFAVFTLFMKLKTNNRCSYVVYFLR